MVNDLFFNVTWQNRQVVGNEVYMNYTSHEYYTKEEHSELKNIDVGYQLPLITCDYEEEEFIM